MADARNKRSNDRTYALKPVSITLKDHPFQLNDISNEGIGIVLEKDGPQFFIGERLEKIPIPLQSGTVNLAGIVSHISVSANGTVCGIRFVFNREDFPLLVQFKKECTDPIQ
ncbi:MAG: PilZ domain-containing protein [Desulfobacterales bacterium]|nr:PilZ domain-containing protein [Desulfobacterales bacterium]